MAEMIDKIIDRLLKGLHIKVSDKARTVISQFIRFGVVGVSNTLLSYVLYRLGLYLLRRVHFAPAVDYQLAYAFAWALSVIWSFYWNRRFVFEATNKEEVPWVRALLKTFASYAFSGLLLNNALLFVWVEMLGISKEIAPLINLVITVPLNFIMNKFWAFRKKKKKDSNG